MKIKIFFNLALLAMFAVSNANAHEYWLEPVTYTLEPGEKIQGNLKNGQDFKGSNFTYIKDGFDQFTLQSPNETNAVMGRSGDAPALNVNAPVPGMYSASYQGTFDRIIFKDEAKIKHYMDYEGLDGVLQKHLSRGLPIDRFEEQYARCAKALFQVGKITSDTSTDHLTGLKYELVAEKNPYGLTQNDTLPVRLYWQGKPIANKQIRMFRFDGELVTQTFRTNTEGRVQIPLTGGGKFMLNSVYIYPGDEDPDTKKAEWISYWASMAFGMNDTDEVLERLKK